MQCSKTMSSAMTLVSCKKDTALQQGEVLVVEDKPALSLLDKIRGKRHSSTDHPSPAASGKRLSFELGEPHGAVGKRSSFDSGQAFAGRTHQPLAA